MVSEKMLKELNDQVNAEMYSSYLYLAMSAYFESKNLNGMAKWMAMQSQEEYQHAIKFYQYINSVGGRVTLGAIDKPQFEWSSAQEVFEDALKHEHYITDRINKLADLALELRDHATNNFLIYFVNEQVEEVATSTGIVEKFKMVGDNVQGLYMINRELGMRQ